MRIIAIGVVVGLMLVGVGYTFYGINKLSERLRYTQKYRAEFLKLCRQIKKDKIDEQTYYNLAHDMKKYN